VTRTVEVPAVDVAGQASATRVVSVDVFRGLTMAVMIFVNDLSSVHGLSKWTYHMPAKVDAMSYVDMVFPAFLFIVGLALPLAVRQRLRRNPSVGSLWVHVVLRVIGLLVLGLILANAQGLDAARTHMKPGAWAVCALLSAMALWSVYPRSWDRRLVVGLRCAAAVALVVLFAMFRRVAADGSVRWIDFSYPEILGLIGVTYLAVCLIYVPLRRFAWAPVAEFAAMLLLNVACVAKWIPAGDWQLYWWPFGNGAMPAITMAGIVVSGIFLPEREDGGLRRKMGLAVMFAALAGVVGWLLVPLGISKIRATPTWALWSVAACVVLFAGLYWICDVRKKTAWAWLLRPAGENTLLTYLLPDLYFYVALWLGFTRLLGRWDAGWPGVVRAVVFTVFILLVAMGLTRKRVRLQL
jgi:heparan-alpha-glucosaminide N-acetyltransferase